MNRRRHGNLVPVAALFKWVVVAFFLCTAGLCYVYFKNQMQSTGNDIRNLETRLNELRMDDDRERAQIDRLSSQSYLERRLQEGFIQLTPITDDHIVRLHMTQAPANATAGVEGGDQQPQYPNRIVAQ
jgi:hypothetical protein